MAEASGRYPEEFARLRARDPDHVIPNGESLRQKQQRVLACGKDIAGRHPGQRVVMVTHGGVLSDLFRRAVGLPLSAPRRYTLFNASINTFFVRNGIWELGTWGDVRHLRRIGTLDDD